MSDDLLLPLSPSGPTDSPSLSGRQCGELVSSCYHAYYSTESVTPFRDMRRANQAPFTVSRASQQLPLMEYPFSEDYLSSSNTTTNHELMVVLYDELHKHLTRNEDNCFKAAQGILQRYRPCRACDGPKQDAVGSCEGKLFQTGTYYPRGSCRTPMISDATRNHVPQPPSCWRVGRLPTTVHNRSVSVFLGICADERWLIRQSTQISQYSPSLRSLSQHFVGDTGTSLPVTGSWHSLITGRSRLIRHKDRPINYHSKRFYHGHCLLSLLVTHNSNPPAF